MNYHQAHWGEMMVDLMMQLNARLNGFLWGPFLIVAILGAGIYLTLGSGFVQILKLPLSLPYLP